MDKPPPAVIYDHVKDTVASNSQELLELVNDKIYSKFSSLFTKHPVIIINNKVPDNVLKWYQTYVFERSESICTPRSDVIDKEPEPEIINGDSMSTTAGSTTIIEMVSENLEPQPLDIQNEVKNDLIQNQASVAMEVADLSPLEELGELDELNELAELSELSEQAFLEDGLRTEVSRDCKDLDLTQEVTKDIKDCEMMQDLPTIAEDILNSILNEVQSIPVHVDKNGVEANNSEPVKPADIVQTTQQVNIEAPSKVLEIIKTGAKIDNTSVLGCIDEENNILDFDDDDDDD